jgi:hypothetical protein
LIRNQLGVPAQVQILLLSIPFCFLVGVAKYPQGKLDLDAIFLTSLF